MDGTLENPYLFLGITALMALVPAALWPWRSDSERPGVVFWSIGTVALAGSLSVLAWRFRLGWDDSFASALWLSVVTTQCLFLIETLVYRQSWRLALLLYPYLIVFAAIASVWHGEASVEPDRGVTAWFVAHLLFSLATYGLLTLSAMAATAVWWQYRALKTKRPSQLSQRLPAVAEGERLEFRFLALAEVVLAGGILTGMANNLLAGDTLLTFDHKTLLSLLAFVLIALVLLMRSKAGLRGRQAARIVLIAYLLITLAFPGVKFVTDVLVS